VRECVTEGRDCLNRGIGEFTYIVRIIEAKNSLNLVKSSVLLHPQSIWIQIVDVFNICENESLLRIKTECYNIFDITMSHLYSIL